MAWYEPCETGWCSDSPDESEVLMRRRGRRRITDQEPTQTGTGSGSSRGPSVDRHGEPVIDPTKNVLDLVGAAIQRQDDLRQAESRHVREIAALRAEYQAELREAESARIDAIRAVDVGAVNRAAEVAATQATTLATQVQVSAETLRTQVAAAATAASTALAAALEPVQKDIADLRRAQYEAQGKQTNVVETRERGLSTTAWLLVGVGFIGLVLTIVSIIVVAAIATHGFTK